MEISLSSSISALPRIPAGYSILPWDESLLDSHAEAKYRSFCFEIDANVFPCLGTREGCRQLMEEIAGRNNFLPESTWLLRYQPSGQPHPENCGTIQGIRDRSGYGAVQNLGVAPSHRGNGLGTCLLQLALQGFRQVGLRRAYLEVTAQNLGALRLYQRFGFRTAKTVYKAAEIAYA